MRTLLILILDDLQQFLRTKRAVIFLVLYLVVFGLIAYVFFQFQAQVEEQMRLQQVSSLQQRFMMEFWREMFEASSGHSPVVEFLFRVPPLNMMLYFVTLIGTPILLFILNYDKISQEIYDGTIRYVLFRASRWQIFLGKFLASVLECAGITFLALFLGVLWASVLFPHSVRFDVSMAYGLRFWAIAQVFLAGYTGLALMASALFKKPFTSLVVCFVCYIFMPLIPFWVPYVSLYDHHYFEGLFHQSSPALWWSLGAYGLFTALFVTIGYQVFKRKDL